MFPALALAIALNVLQPAATSPSTPAPAAVDETPPVSVPPASEAALRYYSSGNRLWVLDQVLSIALLAAILFSGLSARLRTWAERIGRNWFFTIVVYFALFTIVTSVITLPLAYYEEFVRQHDYGLSNQTLQKWWTDSLTALALNIVAGAVLGASHCMLEPGCEGDFAEQTAAAALRALGVDPKSAERISRSALKPVEILSRIVSGLFRVPAVTQAQAKARQGGAPAYLYRFDYNPKTVLDGRVRAFHCAEMAYAFDNVDRCLNATGGTAEARALSARMADAWIAFARTGDPNHKGLPHWPPVSATATPNMLFDAVCTVKDDPDRAELAALKG